MSDSASSGDDAEHEDLLEAQTVFNGPRRIRENLMDGDDSNDSSES